MWSSDKKEPMTKKFSLGDKVQVNISDYELLAKYRIASIEEKERISKTMDPTVWVSGNIKEIQLSDNGVLWGYLVALDTPIKHPTSLEDRSRFELKDTWIIMYDQFIRSVQ